MDIVIISALMSAIIVGIFTVGATWWTFKKNRDALITGVKYGIYAEVDTLWSIYKIKFEDEFPILEDKKLPKDYYVKKKYPLYLYHKYFAVYDSNCSRIGQIPDDKLIGDIVTGYLRARELLDAYLHNNDLLKDLDHLTSEQRKLTSNIYDKDIEEAKSALKTHAKYIAKVHKEVKEFHNKITESIKPST